MHNFTGQERDAETGLDFFNARYMSAPQGRFLSPDPFNAGASLTDPQLWNGYAYVRNSPLNLVDPSGMDPFAPGDPGDPGDCWDDLLCGGYWPPIIPPFGDEPAPQIPPPPPPPTPITIQNTTGVYAQGQWGGLSGNDVLHTGPTPTVAAQVKQTYLDFILGLRIWLHGRPTPPGQFPTRMFGTHWCGVGGAGPNVNGLDEACHQHDVCYDDHGLTAGSNYNILLSAGKTVDLKGCNQSLCDAARSNGKNDRGSLRVDLYFTSVPVGACDPW